MNFNDYKFRCSSVGNLFVEPVSKAAKEAGELSETTKSWLNEIFIEQYYGLRKDIQSKYMTKGIICEEMSISIVQEVMDVLFLEKNCSRYENDYIAGTPDIVTDGIVIDVKTCWDIWSFFKKDALNKLYYYQLQAYMMLTGLKESALFYTLVDTPEHMIDSEIRKATYVYDADDLDDAIENIKRNATYNHLPIEHRYKMFQFEAEPDFAERLAAKVTKAREYLNSLTLKYESNVDKNIRIRCEKRGDKRCIELSVAAARYSGASYRRC
jgi:hypothetical protein